MQLPSSHLLQLHRVKYSRCSAFRFQLANLKPGQVRPVKYNPQCSPSEDQKTSKQFIDSVISMLPKKQVKVMGVQLLDEVTDKNGDKFLVLLTPSQQKDETWQYDTLVLQNAQSKTVHGTMSVNGGDPYTQDYWDRLAAATPRAPAGPIAVLGMEAGTVCNILAHAFPDRKVTAYESNEALAQLAQKWFGLGELQEQNKLEIIVGDGLKLIAEKGPWAQIIIDLFDGDKIVSELLEFKTWEKIKGALMPDGQVVINTINDNDKPLLYTGSTAATVFDLIQAVIGDAYVCIIPEDDTGLAGNAVGLSVQGTWESWADKSPRELAPLCKSNAWVNWRDYKSGKAKYSGKQKQ